ncbi:MAG: hypothetical protein QXH42_08295 [Thermoplasmata archaeon]
MAGNRSRTIALRVGSSSLTIFPTIRGLESERPLVREAVAEVSPRAVALPVSIEGLRGLRELYRGKEPEVFLSHYEEIYASHLSKYGRVSVPPPSFSEAYAASVERGIPVKAIDLSEREYADAFCESVSTASLLFHSLRWRWLRRKRFREETPEDFVLAWDRVINSLKGFRELETKREEHMAARLRHLSGKYSSILAILELERTEGVVRRLRGEGN